jgi:hypothetical protein
MPPIRRLLLLLALPIAGACSDSNSLADPTVQNQIDTVTVGSLTDTPITTGSGFSIPARGQVRTDQTTEFEFAFDIEGPAEGGRPVFLPRQVLGLTSSNSAEPGVQRSSASFDGIAVAPSNGYVTDAAVPVAVGERYVIRSRVVCGNLGVPLYAKVEVLGFEDNSVVLKILTNNNCGYRGLEPGFPDR